ncbi:hypothetical protein AURDEDRAFT_163785 [Auricularia subglabra TFB-10046 SS5]|nr:hypothetical protein AURDEDRAFT_163785 [Auricularia subglabra TFB-10046 SS5]
MVQKLQYDEQLWPAADCELIAQIQSSLKLDRLEGHIGTLVAVSLTDGAWHHTQYTSDIPFLTLTPLRDLPPLSRLLVALTIDDAMLPQLLETPITLAVLRDLFVDYTRLINDPLILQLLVEPDLFTLPPHTCMLQCPALVRVSAFATNSAPVAISGWKLVTLGWMLGQTPRVVTVPALPALVLVNVKVDLEEHLEALEVVFSSVVLDYLEELRLPQHYHPRNYVPQRTQ